MANFWALMKEIGLLLFHHLVTLFVPTFFGSCLRKEQLQQRRTVIDALRAVAEANREKVSSTRKEFLKKSDLTGSNRIAVFESASGFIDFEGIVSSL